MADNNGNTGRTLQVIVDGTPMAPEEARAFWARFSEHMEQNKGDLRGFADKEGYRSVVPALGANGAILRVSRVAEQVPYTNVSKGRE